MAERISSEGRLLPERQEVEGHDWNVRRIAAARWRTSALG